MAIKGTKGQQLSMFMSVAELRNERPFDFVPSDLAWQPENRAAWSGNVSRGYAGKLQESKSRAGRPESLYSKIEREGVVDPIDIAHGEMVGGGSAIWDGHHRAAVAMDARPDDYLVPVVHHDEKNYNPLPHRGSK
jgi:hypothetical protein